MHTLRVSSRKLIRYRPGGVPKSLCRLDDASIGSFHFHSSQPILQQRSIAYSDDTPIWTTNQISALSRGQFSISKSYHRQSIQSFSTSTSSNNDTAPSNRSKFKEIPVNPSILSYIESIGIGIPKRNPAKRRLNRLRKTKTNQDQDKFLTRQEEIKRLPTIRRMPSKIPPPPFAMPESKSAVTKTTIEAEIRSNTSQKPMNQKNKTPKGNNNKNQKNTTPPKSQSHDDKHEREQPKVQRSIRRYPVTCIASVGTAEESFPPGSLKVPEVAIAGRSNVGKSTLLNALLYGNYPSKEEEEENVPLRRKGPTFRTAKLPKGLKAVTSSKPGQTRTIDFYRLTAKVITTSSMTDEAKKEEEEKVESSTKMSLQLVDLPGYGFAYATDDKLDAWKSLMQDYLLNRGKPLKRILLLIDARHGMKMADVEFLESLQQTLLKQAPVEGQSSKKKRELPPIQIVLTKCDLVSQADLARRVVQVQEQLSDCLIRQPSALPVMLVSAQMEGQRGVLELQKELASLVPGISSSSNAKDMAA